MKRYVKNLKALREKSLDYGRVKWITTVQVMFFSKILRTNPKILNSGISSCQATLEGGDGKDASSASCPNADDRPFYYPLLIFPQ